LSDTSSSHGFLNSGRAVMGRDPGGDAIAPSRGALATSSYRTSPSKSGLVAPRALSGRFRITRPSIGPPRSMRVSRASGRAKMGENGAIKPVAGEVSQVGPFSGARLHSGSRYREWTKPVSAGLAGTGARGLGRADCARRFGRAADCPLGDAFCITTGIICLRILPCSGPRHSRAIQYAT